MRASGMAEILKKTISSHVDLIVVDSSGISFALKVRGLDANRPDQIRTITGVSPEVAGVLLGHKWESSLIDELPSM
jgi:hypothetical protein